MAVWLGGLPVLMAVLLRSGDVLGMRLAIPGSRGRRWCPWVCCW
ncbi:hypothetical protein ACFSVJ_17175 [Prauserella oleivorans]